MWHEELPGCHPVTRSKGSIAIQQQMRHITSEAAVTFPVTMLTLLHRFP